MFQEVQQLNTTAVTHNSTSDHLACLSQPSTVTLHIFHSNSHYAEIFLFKKKKNKSSKEAKSQNGNYLQTAKSEIFQMCYTNATRATCQLENLCQEISLTHKSLRWQIGFVQLMAKFQFVKVNFCGNELTDVGKGRISLDLREIKQIWRNLKGCNLRDKFVLILPNRGASFASLLVWSP